MAKFVIKRGGKQEAFKPEKLKRSIRGACMDAHIPAAKRKRIVGRVSAPVLRFARRQKTVRAMALRKKVLAHLRKVEPMAAKAWLRHEKRRKARRKARR